MKYTIAGGKIQFGPNDYDIVEAAMKLPSHTKDHKYNITRNQDGDLLVDGETIVPSLVDTLEWVLDTPPNVHQFEEPPVSCGLRFLFQFPWILLLFIIYCFCLISN